ncbi:MAG: HD domain-containing protein [Bacillota bacterium]|nr:HD domain-containing protein [Bacillota bacterium]
MTYKKIKDLKVNERFDSFFLVKSCEVKSDKNGKLYMDLILGDGMEDINGKIWNLNKDIEERIDNYKVMKIRGTASEWKGVKQLKIERIREINSQDEVNIKDFVQTAPLEPEDMFNEVKTYITKIKNEDIKQIVLEIITKYKDKMSYYPAAKSNHHSIKGGLLYHLVRMLRLGEKLAQTYENINTDLIYAGILLHDVCKIEEMDSNEMGIVNDYTRDGKLLGHITMGVIEVEKAADKHKVDEEIKVLLQHMILSHHYFPEFGSPKKPMILEAEILHYIDLIDARVYDFEEGLKNVEYGDFSDRIWTLDNINIYKRNFDKKECD